MAQFVQANLKSLIPSSRARTLWFMFVVVLLSHQLSYWLLSPVQVVGESMQPNYENGTRHYVNRFAFLTEKPKRGDVVTLRVRQGEFFIKRIVGLPGETIECRNGRIIINGEPLTEYYTSTSVPWNVGPVHLDADHYFVIGDNRAATVLGAVPADRILGKVIY